MPNVTDLGFSPAAGETITFDVGATHQVIGAVASVDDGAAHPLPVSVVAHHKVLVDVAFTGNDGGWADIVITGTSTPPVTDRIEQVTGLPTRDRIYRT